MIKTTTVSILAVLAAWWLLSGNLNASNPGEYIYYVPHVVAGPEYYPANDGYTNLWVIATEDGTEFEIDQDGDGNFEAQFTDLAAGDFKSFYRRNRPDPGTLFTGASVRSGSPLQLVLHFGHNDYGTYDAGFMITTLMPVDMWGETFVVPVDSTYLYIFAPLITSVTVTPPGQSPSNYFIQPRTNIKLSDIPAGTKITAANSLYVLAVNCQPDQNYPWMYNVLPVSMTGNDYYHDSTYGEVDISWPWPTDPKLYIAAVNDSTPVYIDENKDNIPEYVYLLDAGETTVYNNPVRGAHLWSDKNIYVADVENWAAPFIGKYGGGATEYIPTSIYGTNYAVFDVVSRRELPENNPRIFIVASENNTLVDIDFGWNGIDISHVLNKGEVWTVLWPENIADTAHVESSKGIQVIYRSDYSHPDHPGVNVSYLAVPLSGKKEIEAAVDIRPNTLNRKSKGKWITAYIELPGGFDVADIDVGTLAITELNGTPLGIPIYAELSPTNISDYDSDGIQDLMVKFDRKTLSQLLVPGNPVLKLKGQLSDGTTFQGSDTLRVIH